MISGLKRRISLTILPMSSLLASSSPSPYLRNVTSEVPVMRQASLCSSSRIGASRSDVISGSRLPLLPLVHRTYASSIPPSPACTASRRSQTRIVRVGNYNHGPLVGQPGLVRLLVQLRFSSHVSSWSSENVETLRALRRDDDFVILRCDGPAKCIPESRHTESEIGRPA